MSIRELKWVRGGGRRRGFPDLVTAISDGCSTHGGDQLPESDLWDDLAADNAVQDHLLSRSDYFGHGPAELAQDLVDLLEAFWSDDELALSVGVQLVVIRHPILDHDHPAAHEE